MHRLLRRQLARVYGKEFDLVALSPQEQLLARLVGATYEETDKERQLFENTLDLNSRELNEKNGELVGVLKSLADAQHLSHLGSWSYSLADRKLRWSDELFQILEIPDQHLAPSFALHKSRVAEGDMERADLDLSATLAHHGFDEHYHLRLPSALTKIVHEQREVIQRDGEVVEVRGTIQDVTAQKLAEQNLHLYADVFRNSGEAILITDHENRVIAVNDAFTRLTGYTLKDVRGRNPKILSAGETTREIYEDMWSALVRGGFWQGELVDRRKDGSTYTKWTSISVSYGDRGQPVNYVSTFFDVSETKAALERVEYLAHHDALTGLLNRFSFEDQLNHSLHSARRNGGKVALLFIDMDRFKLINDTLGHHAGDALLIEVARRLKENVRASDVVARIGGDEFVVVLTDMKNEKYASPVARTLLQKVGEPYFIDGQEVYSSPSIGIGIYPADGADAQSLIKSADAAMYHAKAQGRNNCQFFTESMNVVARERLSLESQLRQALDGEQFEIHYQPQVCGHGLEVVSFEALLRWQHPSRGLVPPDQFIPILEETKLIVPVGNWVLEQVCKQHAEWRDRHGQRIRMAVNISAQQLRVPELASLIEQLLARYQMEGCDLELEVTESVAMENPENAIKLLGNIRRLGVRVAVDDFGTGYSSLAYLKLLPIQTLKIDRAFIRDLERNANDAAISSAMLALAHNLGLHVVAEGVETEAQKNFLLSHACDCLQGYLFGKPAPAAKAVEQLLQRRQSCQRLCPPGGGVCQNTATGLP